MEIIVNILVMLHLLYLLQHHQMSVEMKPKKDLPDATFYRTSDHGRIFLLAIPRFKLNSKISHVAEVCFTTMLYEAFVSVITPDNLYGNWTENVINTKYKKPECMEVLKRYMNSRNVSGSTMKFVANADISVLVTIYTDDDEMDILTLPPVTSYDTTYYLGDVPSNGYVLIIAAYDNTVVKYLAPQHFNLASRCAWNATCGVNSDDTFVLNATTYSQISFNYNSEGSTRLTGTKVTSSRPVLILYGSEQYASLEATILESELSTKFVLPLFRSLQFPIGKEIIRYTFFCPRYDYFELTFYSNDNGTYNRVVKSAHEYTESFTSYKSPWLAIVYASRFVTVSATYEKGNLVKTLFTLYAENSWPNYIFFVRPKFKDFNCTLNIVTRKDEFKELLFNGGRQTWKWRPIGEYAVMFLDNKDISIVLMQRDPRKSFWVTITGRFGFNFGVNLFKAYNFPGKSQRYKCVFHNETILAGDSIDNDCDGRVDEELWNGEDDDGDVRIDEDLVGERLNGQWGAWRPWHLDLTCRSGVRYRMRRQRFRACDLPSPANGGLACLGKHVQNSSEDCLSDCEERDSPPMCPLGKYTMACTGTCPLGCSMNACDVERGTCIWQRCKPGYQATPYCNVVDFFPFEYIDPRLVPKPRNKTMKEEVKEKGGNLTLLQLVAVPLFVLFILHTCIWANEKFNAYYDTTMKDDNDANGHHSGVADARDLTLRPRHKSILKSGTSYVDGGGSPTPKAVSVKIDILDLKSHDSAG